MEKEQSRSLCHKTNTKFDRKRGVVAAGKRAYSFWGRNGQVEQKRQQWNRLKNPRGTHLGRKGGKGKMMDGFLKSKSQHASTAVMKEKLTFLPKVKPVLERITSFVKIFCTFHK
ncbi:hypothetical protein TNCT_569161 [Trichonephila clavata]|uniref:Uncharacterized protein n=1 Tax=Trichonephila clavata TaxID=2740835 RepID=A0A8X6GS19_TRICU|nr:hypothetical protein TNCT_569161 [Trichonephila clavata]